MSVFNKIFRSRDKPQAGFLFGGTTSGKTVNERSSMQVIAVYACVRILAESVASLPFHIYERVGDDAKKAADHPLYPVIHDEPNPEMTSFVFRETMMAHLLLWGNAYAQIIRDGRGRVLALYPLLPDRMTVDRTAKGAIVYTYRSDTGESVTLGADEVFHIPALGFDGLVGFSPIAMAKNAIGMALATEEYGAKFFANGAQPGGVLEHPETVKDFEKLRDSWNAKFQGTDNAHKVAILEEGMKYHSIGIPPEQAQFLETRKFQLNEIARLYRVPPHMIGDLEKASFNNIEQQSLEFVKYSLDPWVVRWEQAVRKALLLPAEKSRYFVKLNVDGLLRGDFEKRMRGYSIARQNGWLSPNEVRALEDMNMIPEALGGNDYHLNGNMVKLADAGAAYEKKKNGGA